MREYLKYNFSNAAIFITVLLSVVISYFFIWRGNPDVNFTEGDAKDYYSYLLSVFINHDLGHQTSKDWFVLQTGSGTVNVHSVGVSLLMLPFFGLAYCFAFVFNFPLNGTSLPFQVAISATALFFCFLGLVHIKKILQLNGFSDKITALVLLLVFFGTNLLNYTVVEPCMSHVYSFSLIAAFLYHCSKFVFEKTNRHLYISALVLGLIILVRPNNALILFSVFIWFKSAQQFKVFIKDVLRRKAFYYAMTLTSLVAGIQSLIWYLQSHQLFHHTYKADGFYWLNPQIIKMLFGFDGGFFIYVPLCFIFICGLICVYRDNRFQFLAFSIFLLGLFYFFASYWAYTYFDGLGIRVLVDYYALFSLLGAKLFSQLIANKPVFALLCVVSVFFTFISLVYFYQHKNNILLRAGMNYDKWKYIFLKTGDEYKNCLGGCNDIVPYSSNHPSVALSKSVALNQPYNFRNIEFGPGVVFDSLGFYSNRLYLKINLNRKEEYLNSSKDGVVSIVAEDKDDAANRSEYMFRLNETPSASCCELKEYNYSVNLIGRFKNNTKLTVYIWNMAKQAFTLNKFSVKVYNYNYLIN